MIKIPFIYIVAIGMLAVGCQKSGLGDGFDNNILTPDSSYLRQYIGYEGTSTTEVANEKYEYDAELRLKSIISWRRTLDIVTSQMNQYRDTITFHYNGSSQTPIGYKSSWNQYDDANTLLTYGGSIRRVGYTSDGKISYDTTVSQTSGNISYRRFVYESASLIKEYRKSSAAGAESEIVLNLISLPGNKWEQFFNGVKNVECTLDDKKHPFKKLQPVASFFDVNYPYPNDLVLTGPSKNNILAFKLYSAASSTLLFEMNNTYTYRSDGYPVTVSKMYTIPFNWHVTGKFFYY